MYISSEFFKFRSEVFLFHTFALWITFSLESFLPQNFFIFSSKEIFLILIFYFLTSFIFSIVIELFYFFLKFLSTILLRLGTLWKYTIPSILVFLLIFIPLFELTNFKDIFYNFEGVKGNVFIVIFGLSLVLFIILILIFPIFYGLNGGFIILSSILSYSLIRLFADFLVIEFSFWKFIFLYYSLTLLFFLVLQLRRRYALSVFYENFHYPLWFLIIFFMVLFFILLFRIYKTQDFFAFILLSICLYLVLIICMMSLILNLEAKLNSRIFNVKSYVIFFIFLLNIFLFYIFFRQWSFPDFKKLEKTDKIWVYYFFTTIHFLYDTDKDGENHFFANDIENHNVKIRKEGIENERKEIQLPELLYYIPFNYLWITVYIENYKNEPENFFYYSTSEDIKKTLFSLIFNTSSNETFKYFNGDKNKKIKSIFSYLTENYFRTICIGYLHTSSYFVANSEYKIDKGCEILVNLEEQAKNQLKNNIESMVEDSRYYIQNYKAQKNFVWLHTHLLQFKNKIQKKELISFLMNLSFNEFSFPYKKIIFLFFDTPIPHYEVYSDIENKEVVLDSNFSYFGTLLRLLIYNELKKSSKDFYKEDFFINEYNFAISKTLHHYIFIEPKDVYWQELKKIFGNPSLPPISFDIEKKIFYDGRWGIISY